MSGLERNNYFTGKLMTEEDFNDEQQYHMEKHRLHNKFLHGCGVVHGLDISPQGNMVRVSPGVALDCAGNEIIIHETIDLELPDKVEEIYIALSYEEHCVSPVPTLNGSSSKTQYSRIREGFELACELVDLWSGHKKDKSGWVPCGIAHAIPLGRLKYKRRRWRKSHCFRRPYVK